MTKINSPTQLYTIPSKNIEKLVAKGLLEREMEGDRETGRVILDFTSLNGKKYYYHPCKNNSKFYIREDIYKI